MHACLRAHIQSCTCPPDSFCITPDMIAYAKVSGADSIEWRTQLHLTPVSLVGGGVIPSKSGRTLAGGVLPNNDMKCVPDWWLFCTGFSCLVLFLSFPFWPVPSCLVVGWLPCWVSDRHVEEGTHTWLVVSHENSDCSGGKCGDGCVFFPSVCHFSRVTPALMYFVVVRVGCQIAKTHTEFTE